MEHKRVPWIDAIKGFAIINVVIGHVVDGYIGAGMYLEQVEIMEDIFNLIYSFHMALFFAISGMTCRLAYFMPAGGGY